MRTNHLTPYHFFLANAGYSYDPLTQTPMQGRIACAQALAAAEKRARDAGCSFAWNVDAYSDSSDWSDEEPPYAQWTCLARDADGEVFASLGGIDFGRDNEPWDSSYRRVVEAELACELPTIV